jgi:rod shape-determining protein MreC
MKFYKSKFFIISVIIAAVLVLVPALLSAFGYTGIVTSVFKTLAKPFEAIGSSASSAVSGFVSVFTEYDKLKEENAALKEELQSVEELLHENDVLTAENEWLKDYLKMKNDFPELIMTDASIISRESGNYATVLTLDKGQLHGIKKNMPVITADGVFGHVSEIGLDWCKVVSIVETASSVSAITDRTKVQGVVEGDMLLRADGLCKMTYIDAASDIKVGDKVKTGGNGSIYPSGLTIGTVVSIEADQYTRTLIAYIEPAVDFEDLSTVSRVMIIAGYDDGGEPS